MVNPELRARVEAIRDETNWRHQGLHEPAKPLSKV